MALLGSRTFGLWVTLRLVKFDFFDAVIGGLRGLVGWVDGVSRHRPCNSSSPTATSVGWTITVVWRVTLPGSTLPVESVAREGRTYTSLRDVGRIMDYDLTPTVLLAVLRER
jgi:hypothetical protein